MRSSLLTGNSATSVRAVSSHELGTNAESNFLNRLGAKQADPQIRERLYEEYKGKEKKDEGLLDAIVPDIVKSDDEELVDAAAEKERISEKQQAGEKITGEDAKTRKAKAKSVIDQLF